MSDETVGEFNGKPMSLRELCKELGLPMPEGDGQMRVVGGPTGLGEDGVSRIGRERRRQQEAEGYDIQHDVDHGPGVLDRAAEGYLWAARQALSIQTEGRQYVKPHPTQLFPWGDEGWNPSPDPIRNLEKAGALIAAEIDRLIAVKNGAKSKWET